MALKDKWQQDRIGRQQGVQERQQQVQTTLSLWQQERQNQALDDQESRQGFVTGVQQQTQELLTNISTERLWVAQQQREQLENLIQQLSEFREDLEHRVTDLLANYQKQRLEARETLLEDLAIFRQTLYREVEEYLGELDILHQQMAAQLQQQLQQSRTERKDAVQKLFEDLGVFRAELQDYHLKLQQTVWGSSHRHSIKPQPTVNPGVPQPATLDQPQG